MIRFISLLVRFFSAWYVKVTYQASVRGTGVQQCLNASGKLHLKHAPTLCCLHFIYAQMGCPDVLVRGETGSLPGVKNNPASTATTGFCARSVRVRFTSVDTFDHFVPEICFTSCSLKYISPTLQPPRADCQSVVDRTQC